MHHDRHRAGWLLALLLALAPLALAQDATPERALERLFTAEEVERSWFAPAFLEAVPLPQVQQVLGETASELGAFVAVRPAGERYQVVFEGGMVPALVSLDGQGRIQGLRLLPAVPTAAGLEEAVAAFEGLPGSTSVLVLEDGAVLVGLRPDAPLAVGSTFKLAVLVALHERVDAGERAWIDVVELRPGWRSLPSGILQDWPAGTVVTLETLATLMISRSDNTATDALIDVVGRDAVADSTPLGDPVLTTREAFVLKNPEREALRARYVEGDADERRALLSEVAELPLPPASQFGGEPRALQVEWFLSAREACGLMARVQHLPLMSIEPGVADPSGWQRVAYKGGSEPGVLNLTTWLEAEDGRTYCVFATQNPSDAALDESRFAGLYGSLLEVLAGR